MDLKKPIKQSLLTFAALCAAQTVMAKPAMVVMPHCLERGINLQHQVMATSDSLSMVQLEEAQLEELARESHRIHCGGFLNVSHKKEAQLHPKAFLTQAHNKAIKTMASQSFEIHHQVQVQKAIANVEKKNIEKTLTNFSSFYNRYSREENGRKAALWIHEQFKGLVKQANRQDVETFLVETGGSYVQPSIVTKVGTDLTSDAVVIGAHIDTLSGRMPGADDDGSGTSSLMEAARVILNSDKLKSPVYIIWYSAEEMGLIGSQRVVEYFSKHHIKVKSVLQFDMTGYRNQGSDKMWMIGDNVDQSLSKFVESLIRKYIGVDVGWTKCHYACSDHASWTQAGYRSAFPFEAKFGEEDPYIHSGMDKIEYVNFDHMTNFSKLAVAFAIELAS